MKLLKFLPLIVSAMLCMGAADAYAFQGRGDQILLAQFWKGSKGVQQDSKVAERQPRRRRFVMPASGNTYQRRENSQQPGQAGQPQRAEQAGKKPSRMTREERQALRRQINEANQGIYQKKANRPPASRP